MPLHLSTRRMAVSSTWTNLAMSSVILWRSFTLDPKGMHGGTLTNFWSKWKMPLKSSSLHIRINRHFSFSINPLPMLLYHLMLSKLSRWINRTVGSNANSATLSSPSRIQSQSTVARPKRWRSKMVSQRECNVYSKNEDSTSRNYVQNVHRYAPSKTQIVAWPVSSVNRMISRINLPCLKLIFILEGMSAYFFQSSIASLILSKWYVIVILTTVI